MRTDVTIENMSNNPVKAGGYSFPAKTETIIEIETNSVAFTHIRSNRKLKIVTDRRQLSELVYIWGRK